MHTIYKDKCHPLFLTACLVRGSESVTMIKLMLLSLIAVSVDDD